MTEIKEAVKKLRRNMGMTQDEFAEQTGVSRRTLTRIENGEDSSMDALRKIANSTGQELDLDFGARVPKFDLSKIKKTTRLTATMKYQTYAFDYFDELYKYDKDLYSAVMADRAANPKSYYQALLVSQIVKAEGFDDEAMAYADMYFAYGRDGALELAVEKLMFDYLTSEKHEDAHSEGEPDEFTMLKTGVGKLVIAFKRPDDDFKSPYIEVRVNTIL
ncbi:MAG: helix-turn-helix domain-containing protein [Lactobacillus sp.]|jgi:transcriptional regulator with XRE-family HTH domain|nr:helix-turn-helix domain-containing protein [Lactobacillus sp.]MCI2032049.1 helix-turn-helix domain-containing protein [Lactobacillus sp.]